jgi:hypothetical protein
MEGNAGVTADWEQTRRNRRSRQRAAVGILETQDPRMTYSFVNVTMSRNSAPAITVISRLHGL